MKFFYKVEILRVITNSRKLRNKNRTDTDVMQIKKNLFNSQIKNKYKPDWFRLLKNSVTFARELDKQINE